MRLIKKGVCPAVMAVLLALCLLLTACGTGESGDAGKSSGNFESIAGDYYLDLSGLGMKLTIYLRLSENGDFLFSNTTDFALEKSSGILQEGTGEYIMVYDMVNGEEKSVSDGMTSSFSVREDGTLDFSGCERIYYGSASAVTRSEDDPDVILVAVPLPEDYEETDTTSEFTAGTYTAQGEGVSYRAAFYDDTSYILTVMQEENGEVKYSSETGSYGVSTTQLALTPSGGSRLSGEIISASELSIPVPVPGGERTAVSFTKLETAKPEAVLTGQGTLDDGNSFTAEVTIYSDGSYLSTANGFSEGGIIVFDSESGTFKTYPDHPETGVRGLNQIATVPAGEFAGQGSSLSLTDFRLRTSESLSRAKCSLA